MKLSTFPQEKGETISDKLKVLTAKLAGQINSTFSLVSSSNDVSGQIPSLNLGLKLSTFSNGRTSVSQVRKTRHEMPYFAELKPLLCLFNSLVSAVAADKAMPIFTVAAGTARMIIHGMCRSPLNSMRKQL